MYNEKLAQKILEKLATIFPDECHLHQLRELIPEYESIPLPEWLSAINALRLEGKIRGQFLHGHTGIDDAAALYITDLGRSQLRAQLADPAGSSSCWGSDVNLGDLIRKSEAANRQAERDSPELVRKQLRVASDLDAISRRLGQNSHGGPSQEELVRDAREYVAMSLTQALNNLPLNVSESELEKRLHKIRNEVALKVWDEFALGTRTSHSAGSICVSLTMRYGPKVTRMRRSDT